MELIDHLSELLPVLPPFKIERLEKDESKQTVHLYLYIDKSDKPQGVLIHSYYERTWEHLKLFQYRCFIHCRLPIYKDKQSGKFSKATVSFSRDHSRFTLIYEQEVMRLMHIHHCLSTVARQLAINIQRVESIYHHYTQELAYDQFTQLPVNLAYDETSTRKGHEYITTFFDLDTWQIIGIYDGKSADSVKEFFQDHPYPQAVENISIDMSPAFIKGAKLYFGQARITFDKWHVIRLIHKHLDKLGEKAAEWRACLEMLMEDITGFYKQNKPDQLKAQLHFIADFALDKIGKNPITHTILSHFEGIANYAQSGFNNGILEGLNAKIQVIKRVARGFRYKHTFKKMIRFVFNSYQYPIIS
jgi:transposase